MAWARVNPWDLAADCKKAAAEASSSVDSPTPEDEEDDDEEEAATLVRLERRVPDYKGLL